MVMSDMEKIVSNLEMNMRDALKLLKEQNQRIWELLTENERLTDLAKEQEAVKPYMDYDGQDVWRCGKCGNSLMHPSYYESDKDAKNHIRYCSHCGQKVKWE